MIIKKDEVLEDITPGVVRRHYWDESTGTGSVSMGIVTLQPGTALNPHSHLVEDAMIVISGKGAFVVEDERFPMRAGDAALAPAGKLHYIDNDSDEPLVICYTWPSINVKRFNK